MKRKQKQPSFSGFLLMITTMLIAYILQTMQASAVLESPSKEVSTIVEASPTPAPPTSDQPPALLAIDQEIGEGEIAKVTAKEVI